ncbi:Resistance to Phytophthora parasitica 1, Usually multiple acids move in and out Transporters 36 [Hibiscus trionum]|uniref:WAT1-related protein n=1 Tax=Hibiscus trionum TaxID=183268 RepID=A0A9W7MWX2_HIBTR|nr:Resistance to Phytophthora parasitica 1, Usually multiple acids move in and out Transporters 36 [Hibiscus trionum]
MVEQTGERMREAAPFTVMVIMEACTIALTILAKTALTGGLSPFVFVVYTNAIGSSLLLPFSFLYHRRESTQHSLFTFPLLLRIFFLGLTGIAISQNLAFLGLSYSSPIVVCATGLLLPSISFLLSIILRTAKLDWRSSSSQAKTMGTLVSIAGFISVELYRGPFIRTSPVSLSRPLQAIPTLFVFYSTPDRWVLGGILLAAANLSISIWNTIQMGTVKHYPQVMKVASFYSLVGTLQCLLFCLFMERDLDAWKLQNNRDLLLIIVTGVFGSVIRSNVHLACTRMKGPFYVPMFKPFGILFATIFGTSFFTNSLQYGSVIGTVIVGTGYCALMWGQTREAELRKELDVEKADDISALKAPLLQEQEEDAQV